MGRFYHYQGPQSIAQAVAAHPEGTPIRSVADFEQWIHHPEHQTKRSCSVAATFVITQEGVLCLADWHSEHVACAGDRLSSQPEKSFLRWAKRGGKLERFPINQQDIVPNPLRGQR